MKANEEPYSSRRVESSSKKIWCFGDSSKLKHNRCEGEENKNFEWYLDFSPSLPPFFLFFFAIPFSMQESKLLPLGYISVFISASVLFTHSPLISKFLEQMECRNIFDDQFGFWFIFLLVLCSISWLWGYLFALLCSSCPHEFYFSEMFYSKIPGLSALKKIEASCSLMKSFFSFLKSRISVTECKCAISHDRLLTEC